MRGKQVAGIAFLAAGLAALWACFAALWAVSDEIETRVIDGAVVGLQFVGAASPGLSATDTANLYYDTTIDTVQISQNGGAYATLGAFTGGTLTSGLVFSAVTTDITTGTNEDLAISPNGTGVVLAGNTTLNKWTSALTPTAGIDRPWVFNSPSGMASYSDRLISVQNNGVEEFYVEAGGVGRFASNLVLTGGNSIVIQSGIVAQITSYASQSTNGGVNMNLASQANAAGEIGFGGGTTVLLSGATLDTTVFAAGHDVDAVPPLMVFSVNGAGHIISTGSVPSSYTSGTCTNETGTGDDAHGTITADCTAQTLIVTWNRPYGAAPVCTVTAQNAAASAGAATFAYTTSTTVLTLTVTTATIAGTWAFTCIQ